MACSGHPSRSYAMLVSVSRLRLPMRIRIRGLYCYFVKRLEGRRTAVILSKHEHRSDSVSWVCAVRGFFSLYFASMLAYPVKTTLLESSTDAWRRLTAVFVWSKFVRCPYKKSAESY